MPKGVSRSLCAASPDLRAHRFGNAALLASHGGLVGVLLPASSHRVLQRSVCHTAGPPMPSCRGQNSWRYRNPTSVVMMKARHCEIHRNDVHRADDTKTSDGAITEGKGECFCSQFRGPYGPCFGHIVDNSKRTPVGAPCPGHGFNWHYLIDELLGKGEGSGGMRCGDQKNILLQGLHTVLSCLEAKRPGGGHWTAVVSQPTGPGLRGIWQNLVLPRLVLRKMW